MPPPVNQGSKAALITWTVVATVFGITMAVLALIAYTGKNDAEVQAETLRGQFTEFASESDLQDARMTELRALASEQQLPNVYTLLVDREQKLARAATGATRYEQAEAGMTQTLEQVNAANAEAGVNATNLAGAITQLQAQIASLKRENQALVSAQEDLQANLEAEQANHQTMIASKDEAIAAANEQVQELEAKWQELVERSNAIENASGESIAGLQADLETKLRETEDRLTNTSRALETANEQVRILTEQNRQRFGGNQMMAAADGKVLRSPSQGTLYINLGRNQGITNGMTFQVYDAVTGIPKVTAERPTDLPQGKGSVQVIRVDPNSAEARVVNQQIGQNIREGDLIANLAYDKNVPVRFRIYGDFDLDNDGVTMPSDRDRMLTLVREFGGQLVEDVTVETDVLVMGKEPEVPRMTEEELLDSRNQRIHQEAIQRRDDYVAVREQARGLNVPILNQNQFLYYIGYFDQIRR
jgi:hypothetical protein